MDPRPKLHQLRQARAAAYDELQQLQRHPDQRRFLSKASEIETLDEEIARVEKTIELGRRNATIAAGGQLAASDGWKSLGEQLQAIVRASSPGGRIDPRLIRSPLGMGETDPSGGGFAIAPEFASTVLTRAYDLGELLKRCFKLPIEGPGIRVPAIDEQSRQTGSRWGGVQSYWVAEGDSVTATKPKFRLIELYLKKLMSVWYVTDEMLADALALTGIANQAFGEEITFMLEDAIFEGSGAGQPQGISGANALVAVAADKGQATKTITYSNVSNMWQRLWARSKKNAVWTINQDCTSQLLGLSLPVGTGGQPVFLPPGSWGSNAANAPGGTLLGRPIVEIEYAQTLGTQGDISLLDLSEFVVADRNAMQQMTSIHVQFLTDQTTFRLVYRVDGAPVWHTALTPFHGTNTLSPFIQLASR